VHGGFFVSLVKARSIQETTKKQQQRPICAIMAVFAKNSCLRVVLLWLLAL